MKKYWPWIIVLLLCVPYVWAAKKITDLTQLTGAAAVGDLVTVVDISDNTMSANGTNKKQEVQDFTAYIRQHLSKTSSYVIGSGNARESYGGIFDNQGAAGVITFTLPDASVGMVVTILLDENLDVNIDPNGSERILVLTNANGDSISSDATQGSLISLYAISATEWMPMGYTGTWTDAN